MPGPSPDPGELSRPHTSDLDSVYTQDGGTLPALSCPQGPVPRALKGFSCPEAALTPALGPFPGTECLSLHAHQKRDHSILAAGSEAGCIAGPAGTLADLSHSALPMLPLTQKIRTQTSHTQSPGSPSQVLLAPPLESADCPLPYTHLPMGIPRTWHLAAATAVMPTVYLYLAPGGNC